MSKKKRDLLVLAGGATLFLLFVSALYFDVNRQGSANGQEPVGVLVLKTRVAQRRSADRVVWSPIDREELVYNLDAVRTEAGSSALIRLNDATEILMDENSLVVLDFSEVRKTIEFLEGSVIARRGENAQPGGSAGKPSQIVIKADKSEIDLGTGSLDISRSLDKSLAVAVSGGSATVRGKDGTSTITQASSVSISAGETTVREVLLVPESPASGSMTFGDGPQVGVAFAWRSGDAKPPYVIEISDTRDFARSQAVRSRGSPAAIPLASGAYFWRITDASGSVSRIQPFSVLADLAPELSSPPEGGEYSFRNEVPSVRLSWNSVQGANSYEYEVSADPSFSAILHQGKSSNLSVQLSSLSGRAYFWRVKARYDHSGVEAGKYSVTRSFVLRKQAGMLPPAIVLPEENAAVDIAAASRGDLVFAWNAASDAKSYEFSIASASDPRKTLASWTGSSTFAKPALSLAPGEYRWSVRAIAADGAGSEFSPPRALRITRRTAPSPVAPANGLVLEQSLPATVAFGWTGSGETKLTLFSDSGLKTIVGGISSTSARASLSLPSYGTFFWTVSNSDGASEPRELVLRAPLGTPALLTPENAETLEIVGQAGVSFSWTGVDEASAYRFILRKAGEAKPLMDQKVSQTRLVAASGLMSAGEYSWSVNAQQAGKDKTERAGQASFGAFSVTKVRIAAAAKITAPKNGQLIDGLSSFRNGIKLTWKAPEGKAVYYVKIEVQDKPGHAVFEKRTSDISVTVPDLGAGSYVLTVSGDAFDGVPIPESSGKFRIGSIDPLESPELRQPQPGAMVDMTNANSFTFSWSPVSGATSYEIVLTRKDGNSRVFSRIVEKSTSYVFRELEWLDVGDFIFTVKALALDANGTLERSGPESSGAFTMTLSEKTGVSPTLLSPKEIYVPPKP